MAPTKAQPSGLTDSHQCRLAGRKSDPLFGPALIGKSRPDSIHTKEQCATSGCI
jgi:hypothetical protein